VTGSSTLRPPAPARVDVWLTRLDGRVEPHLAAYESLLDPSELERRRRYKAEGAALQHLVGRALVRTTLSRYAAVDPAAWRFAPNAYGRPAIVEPPGLGLTFNLSHTDGLVACAVAHGVEVGVDVERVSRRVEVEALARFSFAPAEAEVLAAAPPEERRELFFAFWTLKEAYIKARGMGLALPLDGFAFDLTDPEPRIAFTARCPDDPGRWAFLRRRATPEHRLALAVADAPAPPRTSFSWTVPLSPAEPSDPADETLDHGGAASS
jgi:4'-phosphopantetheinyl transferase